MTTRPAVNRKSPSGPKTNLQGVMAVASVAVSTSGATATGSFAGAKVGDGVLLNPKANLDTSLVVCWARVVAAGIICIDFTTTGILAATGAITFDVTLIRS